MSDTTPRTPIGRGIGIAIGIAALVSIVVLAFSWPAVTAEPKDLPVGIVGPEEQVSMITDQAAEQLDGAVAFDTYDDRDAAVEAIEQREVYGAIVIGDSPEVLTSSAANASVANLLGGLAPQLQSQMADAATAQATQMATQQATQGLEAQGIDPQSEAGQQAIQDAVAQATAQVASQLPTVEVTDVVPLSDDDPNGTGLVAAAFPLVLGGMLGGIVIAFAVTGLGARITALVVYAAVGGMAISGIMTGWYGVLGGGFWENTLVFGMSLLAIGATIVGFGSLLGRPGIAVGPVLFMLIANPISSANMPKEFLPGAWGDIGQWFPPGAGATLVREVNYFPDAAMAFPWWVLIGWAALGLVLAVIGAAIRRPKMEVAA